MDVGVAARGGYGRAWPIFAVLAAVYCVVNLALPPLRVNGLIKSYLVPPLLWGLVILATVRLPGYRVAAKPRVRRTIILSALAIGFAQVLFYAVAGLFSGFGKSPYSLQPRWIVTNLILLASTLAGAELSRAWLVTKLSRRHPFGALGAIALIYTVLLSPLVQILGLRPEVQTINYVNSTLLPLLAENLLATQLALLAGPLASIAYRGMLQAFWWFCPILPDLAWGFKGLIGMAVPIVGLVVVRQCCAAGTSRARRNRATEESAGAWVVTTIFSVVLIWFSVGVFPIQPAVVVSGSMTPTMEVGDTAIVAKVAGSAIKRGDIIEFRTEERINVMHRVIEVRETADTVMFITKGDANNAPDLAPVIPQNILGKVVFNVRKVGWAGIWIKGFFIS